MTLRGADLRVDLAKGEHVLTEISRKFTRATTERTLAQGGMEMLEWIPDEGGMFALCVARASREVSARSA
jgi:uncharacterized SAM-dependent methyltransferase